jgi:valyl-tRNA synthetase
VETLKQVATAVRQLKADQGAAQKRDVTFHVLTDDAAWSALSAQSAKLTRIIGATALQRTTATPALPAALTPLGTFYLDTGVTVDPAAERVRLLKDREALSKHLTATEARLANRAFTDKAPPAVLEGARRQLADLQAKAAEIDRLLAAL